MAISKEQKIALRQILDTSSEDRAYLSELVQADIDAEEKQDPDEYPPVGPVEGADTQVPLGKYRAGIDVYDK